MIVKTLLFTVRRQCSHFTHSNARIQLTSDGLSAVVTCNNRYILSGDRVFTCDANNVWKGSATCSKNKLL